MTYLALARKWRPRTFADVAGQSHVVRALENALNSGNLHHAFLFTGTRGVGKTTIARIFVKALNCQQAVSAEPCGACSSCLSIDQGRFVDFLEVDAASRTGVDDARELLDNAQYTPAAGRFKVFLIDEVHMLSKAAFNALLKTLEEPPPHVKFLLATTDPQKIPLTVLSRCLQFNLKRLPLPAIVDRLTMVCGQEKITAEPSAVLRLAQAAAGSMRDGLSLLDQALAFGNGEIREAEVAEMLGSLDRERLTDLLTALAGADAAGLLAQVRLLDELAPDYGDVLLGLAACLQQMAVVQVAGPGALENQGDEGELLVRLAAQLTPEMVQLMYQIAVLGRRDLALAPDPRIGFEMTLLRMVAFHPGRLPNPAGPPVPLPPPQASPVSSSAPGSPRPGAGPHADNPPTAGSYLGDWSAFVPTLTVDGAARQLAAHCALVTQTPGEVRLALDQRNEHLLTEKLKSRLTAALQQRLGSGVKVVFTVSAGPADTPANRETQRQDQNLDQAREQLAADPNVQQMAALFGARMQPESLRTQSKVRIRKPTPDES